MSAETSSTERGQLDNQTAPVRSRPDPQRAVALAGLLLLSSPLVFAASEMLQSLYGSTPPVSGVDVAIFSVRALTFALVPLGITALLASLPSFRRTLSGYFAAGFSWLSLLGLVSGLIGTYQRVRVQEAERADLALGEWMWWTVGGDYGNLIMIGAGIAFFGVALAQTRLRWASGLGYLGALLGGVMTVQAYWSLVAPDAGWASPWLVALIILGWLFGVGVTLYRRRAAVEGSRGALVPE